MNPSVIGFVAAKVAPAAIKLIVVEAKRAPTAVITDSRWETDEAMMLGDAVTWANYLMRHKTVGYVKSVMGDRFVEYGRTFCVRMVEIGADKDCIQLKCLI
jgi:hypothetical protein